MKIKTQKVIEVLRKKQLELALFVEKQNDNYSERLSSFREQTLVGFEIDIKRKDDEIKNLESNIKYYQSEIKRAKTNVNAANKAIKKKNEDIKFVQNASVEELREKKYSNFPEKLKVENDYRYKELEQQIKLFELSSDEEVNVSIKTQLYDMLTKA